MLDQAKMLWKAKQMQKELKKTEIEAQSNDGLVRVVVNAEMNLKEIELNQDFLKPENKKLIEQTILKTLSEAMSRAQGVAAEKTRDIMKDMNLNIPGM